MNINYNIRLSRTREGLFTRAILLSMVAALLALYAFSVPDRFPDIDEAILGEHAYWLAKEGKVKADMYTGTGVGWDKEILVYHKLFIWMGTGVISIFGLSVTALRLISFVFSILLCLSLYFYCRSLQNPDKDYQNNSFLFCLLILLLNSFFFDFSFTYRPEIFQAFLGFGSFFALSLSLRNGRVIYLFLAAVLAGLAALTHLNGLIFIGAGGLLLLFNRKPKQAFIFGGLAILVTSIYLIHLLATANWNQFIWQFQGDPALEKSDFSVLNRIGRVLNEQKRYFHSQVEGAFSILFLICLILKGKFLWTEHKNLLLYLLSGALLLACIGQAYTSKYAILLLPFACLLIAFTLNELRKSNFSEYRFLLVCITIYGGIHLHNTISIISKRVDITARNASIGSYIPAGSRVYATPTFFFNGVEKFKVLSTQSYYLQVSRYRNLSLSKKDFFAHVQSLNCPYIVLDVFVHQFRISKVFRPEELELGQTHYGYTVTHAQDEYVILQKL